jgi:hypothetical protein
MRAVTWLVLMVIGVACSNATRGSARDRSVIRSDEIATIQAANAHEIVAKLRSEFLRSRGPITAARGRTDPPVITVFVDGVEAGPIDQALRVIPASDVVEIRLYRAADAATKYGSRHNGGVVDVKTRRASSP